MVGPAEPGCPASQLCAWTRLLTGLPSVPDAQQDSKALPSSRGLVRQCLAACCRPAWLSGAGLPADLELREVLRDFPQSGLTERIVDEQLYGRKLSKSDSRQLGAWRQIVLYKRSDAQVRRTSCRLGQAHTPARPSAATWHCRPWRTGCRLLQQQAAQQQAWMRPAASLTTGQTRGAPPAAQGSHQQRPVVGGEAPLLAGTRQAQTARTLTTTRRGSSTTTPQALPLPALAAGRERRRLLTVARCSGLRPDSGRPVEAAAAQAVGQGQPGAGPLLWPRQGVLPARPSPLACQLTGGVTAVEAAGVQSGRPASPAAPEAGRGRVCHGGTGRQLLCCCSCSGAAPRCAGPSRRPSRSGRSCAGSSASSRGSARSR